MPLTKDRPPSYSEAARSPVSPVMSYRSGSYTAGPPASSTGKSASRSNRYSTSGRPQQRRSSMGPSYSSNVLVLPQTMEAEGRRSSRPPPQSPERRSAKFLDDRRRSNSLMGESKRRNGPAISPTTSPRVSRQVMPRSEKESPHWSPRSRARSLDPLAENGRTGGSRDRSYFLPKEALLADSPPASPKRPILKPVDHTPDMVDAGIVPESRPRSVAARSSGRGITKGNALSLFAFDSEDRAEPRVTGTIRGHRRVSRTSSQPVLPFVDEPREIDNDDDVPRRVGQTPSQAIADAVRKRTRGRSSSRAASEGVPSHREKEEAANVMVLPMAAVREKPLATKAIVETEEDAEGDDAEEADAPKRLKTKKSADTTKMLLREKRSREHMRTSSMGPVQDVDPLSGYVNWQVVPSSTDNEKAAERRGRRKPPPALIDTKSESIIPPPPPSGRKERSATLPSIADINDRDDEEAPKSPKESERVVKPKKSKRDLEAERNVFVVEGALFGAPPEQVLAVPQKDEEMVKKALEDEEVQPARPSKRRTVRDAPAEDKDEGFVALRSGDSSVPRERETAKAEKRASAVRTSRADTRQGLRSGSIPHAKKAKEPKEPESKEEPAPEPKVTKAAKKTAKTTKGKMLTKSPKPKKEAKKGDRTSSGILLGLPKIAGWQRFSTASTATPTVASSVGRPEDIEEEDEEEAAAAEPEVKRDKGKGRARSSRSASEAGDDMVVVEKQQAVDVEAETDDEDDHFYTEDEGDGASNAGPSGRAETASITTETTERAPKQSESIANSTSYSGSLMALVGGVGTGLFAWVSGQPGSSQDERVSSSPIVTVTDVKEGTALDIVSLVGETIKPEASVTETDVASEEEEESEGEEEDESEEEEEPAEEPATPVANASKIPQTAIVVAKPVAESSKGKEAPIVSAQSGSTTSAASSDESSSDSGSDPSDKPPSYKAAASPRRRPTSGSRTVTEATATARHPSPRRRDSAEPSRRDRKKGGSIKSRSVPSRKTSTRRHSRQGSGGSVSKRHERSKSAATLFVWDKRVKTSNRMSRNDSAPGEISSARERSSPRKRRRGGDGRDGDDGWRDEPRGGGTIERPQPKKRFSLAFWGRTNSSPAELKQAKAPREPPVPKGPSRLSVAVASTGNAVSAGGKRATLVVTQTGARAGDVVKAGGASMGRMSMKGLMGFMNFTDALAGAEKPKPTEDNPARRRTVAFSDDKAAGAAEIKKKRPVLFGRVTVTNAEILDLRRTGDRASLPPSILPFVKDVPRSALKVRAPAEAEKDQTSQAATIEGLDKSAAATGLVYRVGQGAEASGSNVQAGIPVDSELIAVTGASIASGSGTHADDGEIGHVVAVPESSSASEANGGIVSRIAAYLPIPGTFFNEEPEVMTPAHEGDDLSEAQAAAVSEGKDVDEVDEPAQSTSTAMEPPLTPPRPLYAKPTHGRSTSSVNGSPPTTPKGSSKDVPRSRSLTALSALTGSFVSRSPPASPSSPGARERKDRDPNKIFSSEEYNAQPDVISGRLY